MYFKKLYIIMIFLCFRAFSQNLYDHSVANYQSISQMSRENKPKIKSIIDHNTIVGYYGSPLSKRMGILGEFGKNLDSLKSHLQKIAKKYDAINGDDGVILAFHLIYAVVYPDADVGILPDDVVLRYINYGLKHNMIVILDFQPGRYSTTFAIKKMLRWLKYKNVHLGIDPEWATSNPGREIGSLYAQDITRAQKLMNDYLIKNNINEKKILIVHQFEYSMLKNRLKIKDDFQRVQLVHNADGFGSPNVKKGSWNFNTMAKNMPIKGFKLFYPKPWKKIGFDKPMMSPSDVLSLKPTPKYINYQ